MGFVQIKLTYTILSLKYMYIYYGLNLNYLDCRKLTQNDASFTIIAEGILLGLTKGIKSTF